MGSVSKILLAAGLAHDNSYGFNLTYAYVTPGATILNSGTLGVPQLLPGITPSFAFVEQPQTNGVAERFNRTLKEQVIHGRIFRNLAEVREAVAAFVERYNAEWRVEKLGFLTPREARDSFGRQEAA